MRFSFIGEFALDTSKENNVRRGTTDKGSYLTIRPSIIAAKNNRGFCEIFGMKQKVIKTKNQNNEDLDVAWDDRFDPEIIKKVAAYRKYVISFNGEKHEFLSKYDFNEWILEHLEELKGKRVLAVGRTQKNYYQGKARDTFPVDSIYEIGDDDKRKNILSLTGVIFWNKDSIDAEEFKKSKKIYINGYTSEYISKEEGNKFVAQQFVLNCSRIDFENEEHINQMQARLMQLGLMYEDGKIVNKLKKAYVCNEFEIRVINGAEEVEFTIEQCTPAQKQFIQLGIKTLEDFRPRGSFYGNRTSEYQIKDPTLLGDYSGGMVDYDGTATEFEDLIYVPVQDEKADHVFTEDDMNPPEEPKEDEKAESVEDEDLF